MSENVVSLRSSAWFGDTQIKLNFPKTWNVEVVGSPRLKSLSIQDIKGLFARPFGTRTLSSMALDYISVAIVIDDITRPTPTHLLIPLVIEELVSGGISLDNITIYIAGGTHKVGGKDEIIKKVGVNVFNEQRIVVHDLRYSKLKYIGKTDRGIPIQVNEDLLNSELKIGIGGIYPHPSVGFSGGAKTVIPGMCGLNTAKALHDLKSGTRGSRDNQLRLEINRIAEVIGLDFVVNVVLNQDREIVSVFSGDKDLAHKEGVSFFVKHFSISPATKSDIIITDTYPFDTHLLFASGRGFWPLFNSSTNCTKVAIATCPMGMGSHKLVLPCWDRLWNRIKHFNHNEISRIPERMKNMQKLLKREKLRFYLLSKSIDQRTFEKKYPNGFVHNSWNDLLHILLNLHPENNTHAVIYQCAPLHIIN
jgi:nickel-dependent lactate racemase